VALRQNHHMQLLRLSIPSPPQRMKVQSVETAWKGRTWLQFQIILQGSYSPGAATGAWAVGRWKLGDRRTTRSLSGPTNQRASYCTKLRNTSKKGSKKGPRDPSHPNSRLMRLKHTRSCRDLKHEMGALLRLTSNAIVASHPPPITPPIRA
jgi:hypothetical protein